MIRMLLIGYCFGIRSERRLCEEVHLNLACRWLCRLGLDAPVPDHSTFSKNRHGRFRDSQILRELFETTVHRYIEEGLVGGENFAVDASINAANAYCGKGEAGRLPNRVMHRRAVQEYIATLDEAAFGAASDVPSKYISPVDPAARWTRTRNTQMAKYSYSVNYLIDCEVSIIMDVEGSGATIRQAEVNLLRILYKPQLDEETDDNELSLEETDVQPHMAEAAYHALSTIKCLPDQRGENINYDKLESWCNAVVKLVKMIKREGIAWYKIGELLAHSRTDHLDKMWPHTSVRKFIEQNTNERFYEGVKISNFNNRGTIMGSSEVYHTSSAEKYEEMAKKMDEWPNTREILKDR